MSEASSKMGFPYNRWIVLLAGITGMVAIANYQYGWTLFVVPIAKGFGVSNAVVQVAFTTFILLETWPIPIWAYVADRYSPRLVVAVGGVLVLLGWVLGGYATNITQIYIGQGILAGTGAGMVYGTAVGSALKWFPDRRGFAAGLTAAGFGAGSAATVLPILMTINTAGYKTAFITWGLIQGIVVIVAALFIVAPPKGWTVRGRVGEALTERVAARQTKENFTPIQMVRKPNFWVMYIMMTMVATGGLMAIAQFDPIAREFAIRDVPVTLLAFTLPAIGWTLTLDRLLNGFTRPFFGWVSDHIGREYTMTIAFSLEALAIIALTQSFGNPLLFVLISGLVFFGWGEIYSLFPSMSADFFGKRYASTNYALLYTAKGTASIFIPFGSIWAKTIGWQGVFTIAIVFDIIAALLAFFVLRRLKVPTLPKASVAS